MLTPPASGPAASNRSFGVLSHSFVSFRKRKVQSRRYGAALQRPALQLPQLAKDCGAQAWSRDATLTPNFPCRAGVVVGEKHTKSTLRTLFPQSGAPSIIGRRSQFAYRPSQSEQGREMKAVMMLRFRKVRQFSTQCTGNALYPK